MTAYSRIKRILFGNPIATKHAHHERLPVWAGLPIFASDALSSVAYATEEILHVLALCGPLVMVWVWPTTWWLSGLMILVAFSYFQTIYAYPKGGGTYLVSTENLGSWAGRVAGASLLIDYVLTVAVSISSGVAAIVSLNHEVKPWAVPIAITAVVLLMIANLRGAKESGLLFAIPTYSFVFMVLALIFTGVFKSFGQPHIPFQVHHIPDGGFHAFVPFILFRAFAASCTALTGTEAIADGVQAFQAPEAKNAGKTLLWMVGFLLVMSLGISYLAFHFGIAPFPSDDAQYKTVVAQVADRLWGTGFLYWTIQIATALILFLAANTAFADFPRLSSFIARDGYLPRQLGSQGDRLVFQNGIILLSLAAIALIIGFHADTHSLVPLYAMGVFISFTLSQAGMAVKFWKEKAPKWKFFGSALGGLVTFVVLGILLVTKWEEKAWIIIVAIGVMLGVFHLIRKHYHYLAKELELTQADSMPQYTSTVLLLVPRLHRGILRAIAYARASATDVRAIHVTLDPKSTATIKSEWNRFGGTIPLVILESPYRSLIEPVMDYIDQAIKEDPNMMITVIVPQAVPKFWWHSVLHNNLALALKAALGSRKNVVITNVRYFLS